MTIRNPTASAKGFELVATTNSWNLWATDKFRQQYQMYFTDSATEWLDSALAQLSDDFAYSMKVQGGTSWKPPRMDCVLDPSAQGGAHTGTIFGPGGISISPDSLYNSAYGIPRFWWYILTMHETVNVLTGSIASSWVWADGSPLWAGSSPFPNMCDIVASGEVGKKDVSDVQLSRMDGDPGVRLFLGIQQKYGWRVYQRLFSCVRTHGIKNWNGYPEPRRTAILVWFLSFCAGATTQSGDNALLEEFNSALRSISGQEIPDSEYRLAQSLFPRPDTPHY